MIISLLCIGLDMPGAPDVRFNTGGSPGAASFPLLLEHLAYCCRAASVLKCVLKAYSHRSGLVEESYHNLRNADQYVVSVLSYSWLCVKARLTIIVSSRSGIGLPGLVLHSLGPLVDVPDVLGWCTKFESAEHHLLSRSRHKCHSGCSGFVPMDVLECVSCRRRQDELPREHSCVPP